MTIPLPIVRLLNPIVTALLRSRLHGWMSADVMLLTFTGRKTGRTYTTPVTYVRDGSRVRVFTQSPWWRNCRDGAEVTLLLQGAEHRGRSQAIDQDRPRMAEALSDLLRRVPRDAGYYDVKIGPAGKPDAADIERAIGELALIEIQLAE